ncbi:MAG: hypothetical protein ACLUSP_02825 [Christensenellales bacterium]
MDKTKTSGKVKKLRIYSVLAFAFMLVLVLCRVRVRACRNRKQTAYHDYRDRQNDGRYSVSAVVVMPQETTAARSAKSRRTPKANRCPRHSSR